MSTIVTRSGKGSPLTHAEVDSNFTNLNTDKLELSGGTMTGDVGHGDNVKATFGASADLQVYHDGSNSYIQDAGTGQLILRGSNSIVLNNADNSKNMVVANDGGEVSLYHNGSSKLATTSTGVDITGTLTSDGLTVEDASSSLLSLMEDGSSGADVEYNGATNNFVISTGTFGSGSQTPRLAIQRDSGDISFYEDTGTTAKFFWDASQENLGIGTSSPNSAADLHIHSTSGTALWLTSGGSNPSDAGFIRMSEQFDGSGAYFELQHDGSNNVLNLYSSNQGAVVQSWDRVGGNTNFHNSSGTAKLTWSAADEELQLASGVALELNGWTITESGGSLYFATGGTNKMKLDASGNLDVVGSVNSNATIT